MSEYVLEARGNVKRFPGVRALGVVDFRVKPGEVHALVGENGAGKSTLMMVLGGIYQPDEGEIFVNGRRAMFQTPRDSIKSGIGIVFQELSLVPQLSVSENIFFNRQPVGAAGWWTIKSCSATRPKCTGSLKLTTSSPACRCATCPSPTSRWWRF
jgi:ABC-type sugar transport system ATPase subunit